jgi:hypothetical protein
MAAVLVEPEQEEEAEEPAPSAKSSPKQTAILKEPESGRHDAPLEDEEESQEEEAPQTEEQEEPEVESTAAQSESESESEEEESSEEQESVKEEVEEETESDEGLPGLEVKAAGKKGPGSTDVIDSDAMEQMPVRKDARKLPPTLAERTWKAEDFQKVQEAMKKKPTATSGKQGKGQSKEKEDDKKKTGIFGWFGKK